MSKLEKKKTTINSNLNIICLETEAFYKLIEEVVGRLSNNEDDKEQWITDYEAMDLLKITSKTTLQKYRDSGQVRYSQIGKKVILYDRFSIMEFIERNAKETF